MADPTVYSSNRQFLSLGRESQQGTAVSPTVTIPVDTFEPEEKPVWLDDKALRGSLTDVYNRVQGPMHTEWSAAGPAFFDSIGYWLANICGDLTYSGTYTGSGTTTLASTAAAGATTISTNASISNGTRIQISTDNSAEVRVITNVTGAGPYTLTLNTALLRQHASGQTVRPVTTPYQTTFALLNSGNGQPNSMTLVDWQGPTASVAARAYPGACLSELTLKGSAESSLVMFDAKGLAWPSAAASAEPTSSPSTALPQAAWRTTAGLAGPASGGTQVLTVGDWAVTIRRELQPIWTAQNSQNPYFIQRGKLTCSGTLNFTAVNNETPLTYLISNTQPQLQLVVSNGLSGANLLSLQVDAQAAAWNTSKINRSKAAVGYDTTWDGIANTTNAGYSGGYSPIMLTINNAIAANGY